MINIQEYYLNTFGVNKAQMEKLVDIAREGGNDYSDLFFENTSHQNLMLKDGKVSSGGIHIDYGVGIRALRGEKTGYAYSESTDMPSMIAAAKAASAISAGDRINVSLSNFANRPSKSYPGNPNPSADRYPILQDWRDIQAKYLSQILLDLQNIILEKDNRIIKVIAILSAQVSDILMFNSSLEMKYESRPLATIAVSVIFKEKDKIINNHVSRSYRMGAEMLSQDLLNSLANDAVKNLDDKFKAERPKGGKMQVVMGAGASGILLHEAMGHAFEADFNRKGQSIFSDKLGKKICNDNINIVDDATINKNRGSLNFDDEGVPAQKTYMVENGVLTSYLHDRISAKYYDVSPTGNGRRESFRYNPIPRMRATYMESGDSSVSDIISSVKNGVFVDEFSNGQVQIGEGDFTFYVKSGYLIENGELTKPIKDINIMGNGPEALANITAVADDAKIDEGAWTCGKEQNVPVSCGIPTVLVENLTVGGN